MLFRGKYAFLSNFYPTTIVCELGTFKSVESAFHAYKYPGRASEFYNLSAKEAKILGRTVTLRADWENVKVDIMRNLLNIKFSNPELLKKLKAIDEPIIEDNYWNDTFWGVCTNKKYDHVGQNMLGKLLTEIKEKN